MEDTKSANRNQEEEIWKLAYHIVNKMKTQCKTKQHLELKNDDQDYNYEDSENNNDKANEETFKTHKNPSSLTEFNNSSFESTPIQFKVPNPSLPSMIGFI